MISSTAPSLTTMAHCATKTKHKKSQCFFSSSIVNGSLARNADQTRPLSHDPTVGRFGFTHQVKVTTAAAQLNDTTQATLRSVQHVHDHSVTFIDVLPDATPTPWYDRYSEPCVGDGADPYICVLTPRTAATAEDQVTRVVQTAINTDSTMTLKLDLFFVFEKKNLPWTELEQSSVFQLHFLTSTKNISLLVTSFSRLRPSPSSRVCHRAGDSVDQRGCFL